MLRLLKKYDYKESFWKNGAGKTQQIAIYPEHASLVENNFLWRISLATIEHKNSFSLFRGYQRLLIIWSGEGLLLNGSKILPHAPIQFSGDEEINCDLIGFNPVIDFGIIYKKEFISAELKTLSIDSDISIELKAGTHFIFLAAGETVTIADKTFEVGECLSIEFAEDVIVPLKIKSNAKLFLSSLYRIG